MNLEGGAPVNPNFDSVGNRYARDGTRGKPKINLDRSIDHIYLSVCLLSYLSIYLPIYLSNRLLTAISVCVYINYISIRMPVISINALG